MFTDRNMIIDFNDKFESVDAQRISKKPALGCMRCVYSRTFEGILQPGLEGEQKTLWRCVVCGTEYELVELVR